MPEIQAPGVASKLRSFFNVKGVGDISSLAPEVVPVALVADLASVTDAPEQLKDQGIYLWQTYRKISGGGALAMSKIQVGVPASERRAVSVLMGASIKCENSSPIVTRISDSELLNEARALRLDTRAYNVTSAPAVNAVTATWSEAAAGAGLGTTIGAFDYVILSNLEVVKSPVILKPDTYFVIEMETDNLDLYVSAWGYEWVTPNVPRS